MDHSIVIYLLGPNGKFLDFFTQLMTAPEIIAKVEKAVRSGAGTERAASA